MTAFLTVREAGEQIGVSERTAWSLVKQGRLVATRISPRVTRIAQSALDDFLIDCTDKRVGHEPDVFADDRAA